MLCPKCGRELVAQAKFCAHCGANIQSVLQQSEEAPSIPQKNVPEVQTAISAETVSPGDASDSDYLAVAVGTNQAYYLPEFQKIQAGEKSRFNWAAFLFGPVLCFYRKCEDLFKRYYLIAISIIFVGYVVQTIGIVQFNLILITGGGIIAAAGGILGFVNAIRLGIRFNQLYFERCSKLMSPDKFGTSVRAVVVFCTVIVLSGALIAGAAALAAWHRYSTIFEPDELGKFDVSDMQGSFMDTSGSLSQPMVLPTGNANEFDDVIGLWENENGNGDYLYISYEDETARRTYAEVATDEIYFVAELTRIGGEYIYGVSPETQDSSSYEIELDWIGDGFEATIYYDEYVVDYITFVPFELNKAGYQEPSYTSDYGFDALTGIWEDEDGYGHYLFIGYADETKQRAFAQVSTAAADFEVELKLTSEDSAEGHVMDYGSEPLYAIDICRYKYWLEANIYYNEYGFEDYIKFVPADALTCPYENPYYVP